MRHCGPLCSKLVAAVSGSICIAVVSVRVGVIVLSEQTVVVAAGVGLAGRVELSSKPVLRCSRPLYRILPILIVYGVWHEQALASM